MKAVVIEQPGVMHQVDAPTPEPVKGFVRVRVASAAICATDLEVIDGRIAASYPLIPGHEWSGIVDAAGEGVDESWVGKRVIGSNDVVCCTCDACRSGNWRYCKDFEEIGFRRNGAYAEYIQVPAYGLYEIPESVSFDEAALCEPLGVAIGTMKKTGAVFGQTALIMGAGSIGLCMLEICRVMGLRKITVCDLLEDRLAIAKERGAYRTVCAEKEDVLTAAGEVCPEGYDVVIDATGMEQCITDCIKVTKKGGVLALAGYGRGKVMNIRVDDIHVNNLRVVGAGNNWNHLKLALELMEDGMVDMKPMISERIALEDFEKGISLVRNRPGRFVKALYHFDI
ncbi:MAG: alcohol dehydrogenase catalytic domain-containing protein [Clostridia bacterium]|nr:alcohol dehydrogenase catalytic domain-containing protein [Clostridia bacterium]